MKRKKPRHLRNTQQSQLLAIITNLFPKFRIDSNVRNLQWLVNPATNRKLEIDIVVYDSQGFPIVMIEFDGIQHVAPVRRFGGKKALQSQQLRDALKNRLLFENSDKFGHFVRFPHTTDLIESNVREILQQAGVVIPC